MTTTPDHDRPPNNPPPTTDHPSPSSLPIAGYQGQPVANQLLRPTKSAEALAVLLPGFGYALDGPLFVAAQALLLERGWDVLRVEYAYSERPAFRNLPNSEQRRWLLADATAAYQAGLAHGPYARVALIGKSLGTVAMGHLLTLPDPPAVAMRAVWLTPLLNDHELREQIRAFAGPSLFVIGTADPHYDPAVLAELTAATNGEAVVIENADHGMNLPGDPVASARAQLEIAAAVNRFLS